MTAQRFRRIYEGGALGTGGTGKPTGIAGTSGVSSVSIGTSGGALSRAKCWGAVESVLGSGALISRARLAWAINSATAGHAAVISDGGGWLFEPDPTDATVGTLARVPALLAESLPSNLSKGGSGATLSRAIVSDFRALTLGFFSPLEFLIDRYAYSNTGAVRIIAYWSVGVCVTGPTAFAVIGDIAG